MSQSEEAKCCVCGKKIKEGDRSLTFTWNKRTHIFCTEHTRKFNRMMNRIDVYLPMIDEMDDLK